MIMQLTTLEREVLYKLLAGNQPIIRDLRLQLTTIEVDRREFTGVGFFSYFRVDDSLITHQLLGKSFHFGDVVADIEGLKHGAGFVLFVKDGAIDNLEGYSYDEKWPDDIRKFKLRYLKEGRRDFSGAF